MADQVFVQVRFEVDTEVGRYSDALYYTLQEYENTPEKEIQLDKQIRIDMWIDSFNNQTVAVEPTKEELIELQAELDIQKSEIQAKIDSMTIKGK